MNVCDGSIFTTAVVGIMTGAATVKSGFTFTAVALTYTGLLNGETSTPI